MMQSLVAVPDYLSSCSRSPHPRRAGWVATLLVLLCIAPGVVRAAEEPKPAQQAAGESVVLYEEDKSEPQGRRTQGSVTWRSETVKADKGPDQIAARADVDVPHKFRLVLLLKRNTDPTLPASHIIELTFTPSPDSSGQSIDNVPGMLMKTNEQARGTPLAGVAVKITGNRFMIGLSGVDADLAQNTALLQGRAWIDVPMFYAASQRGIVAIEKGRSGQSAIDAVFATQ